MYKGFYMYLLQMIRRTDGIGLRAYGLTVR
jgi:hypothetical protein